MLISGHNSSAEDPHDVCAAVFDGGDRLTLRPTDFVLKSEAAAACSQRVIVRNDALVAALCVLFIIRHVRGRHGDRQYGMFADISLFRQRKGQFVDVVLFFVFVFQAGQIVRIAGQDLGQGVIDLIFQHNVAFAESIVERFRQKPHNRPQFGCVFLAVDCRVDFAVDLSRDQGLSHLLDVFVFFDDRRDCVLNTPFPEILVVGIRGEHAYLHPRDLLNVAVIPAVVIGAHGKGAVRIADRRVGEKILLFAFRGLYHVGHNIVNAAVQTAEEIRVVGRIDKFKVEAGLLGDADQALDIQAAPVALLVPVCIGCVVEHGCFYGFTLGSLRSKGSEYRLYDGTRCNQTTDSHYFH